VLTHLRFGQKEAQRPDQSRTGLIECETCAHFLLHLPNFVRLFAKRNALRAIADAKNPTLSLCN